MADALLQHTIDEGAKAIDSFAPSAMRLAEHLVKNPPKSLAEVAKEMAPLVSVRLRFAAASTTDATVLATSD